MKTRALAAAAGIARPRSTTSRTQRRNAVIATLVCCALGSSCTRSFRNPFLSSGPPAPDVLAAGASLDQIVAAVNHNAQLVQSYQSHNASINLPGSLGVPTLRGNIAVQRPGRVRLEASTALTGPEVDLGSNEELFWFWVKRNEPPAVYFARHSQTVGSAAQQLMPIEPQWLVDALGMAEFRGGDRHEGPLPVGKNRFEIKSTIASPQGPLTKRTVVDAAKAWVIEQHLYDATGRPLASAVAKSHRYYPETGVSLPQEIEIRIPPAELAMTIDVGTVELNRLVDNPNLWTLPTKPGSPAVDLGASPPADPGGGVPTMGAQLNNADWHANAPAYGYASSRGSLPAAPPVQTMPAQQALAASQGATTPLTTPFAPPASGALPPSGIVPPFIAPSIAAQPGAVGTQRLPAGGIATSGVTR